MTNAIKNHCFSNGFRVVYETPSTNLPLSSVYIFCDIGSVHEPDSLRGVSHMIEHMCFKGTKLLPNSKDIFIKYDEIGAYFNAFTSKRYTCFTIKCQDDYLHHCIDVVADIMLHSIFQKKEYTKEHGVVIEENNNNENNNEIAIHNDLDRLLYIGSSYEHPVDELSNHSSRSLQHKDVVEFYHSAYQPNRMLMSIVSHINFKSILKMVEKTTFVKNKPRIQHIRIPPIQFQINYPMQTTYHMKNKNGMSNLLLYIGFRTCTLKSPDKYVLDLLSQIIGSALSGKLLYVLREERALVYSAKIDTDYFEHMGNFSFRTQTDPKKLLKFNNKPGLLPSLISIINKLISNGVTENEIEIAKGSIRGNFLLKLENITTQTIYNGEKALMGEDPHTIVPYKDVYEIFFHKITKQQINEAIKKYFRKEHMCVCLMGERLPDLRTIQKECEKLGQMK